MSSRGSTPLCGTPVRDRSSPFGEKDRSGSFEERPPSSGSIRSPLNSNAMDIPSSMVCAVLKC